MISAVPSVSSVHVELDGRLPSTAGRTDETTKRKIGYLGIQNKRSSESEKKEEKTKQNLKQGPRGYRL